MFRLAFSIVVLAIAGAVHAQTISLADLEARVNERSTMLSGYEAYLRDPDPNRAMAAFQIMLESGDPTLVQLALSIGVYSPDTNIRQTALKAFFAGKPSLDLFFQGADMDENRTDHYPRWMKGLGGSAGGKDSGSASFKVGEWSDELGCYLNQNDQKACLLRVNATTISIFLNNADKWIAPQWVNLTLSDSGNMVGSILGDINGERFGVLAITLPLAE